MTESDSLPVTDSQPAAPATRGSSLVKTVGLLCALFVGSVLFFGVFDGVGTVTRWMRPPLSYCEGNVVLGDVPLTQGQVMTRPERGGKGSIGVLDERGHFVLLTDVDGKLTEGAFVGEHRVIVIAQQTGRMSGPGIPSSLLAPSFTQFDTTTLRIMVDRDQGANRFSLKVTAATPEAAKPEAQKPS